MNSLEEQEKRLISARKILRLLRDGNVRHQRNYGRNRIFPEQYATTKNEQDSLATVLSCADNIISPEMAFDHPAEILHKVYAPGAIVNDKVLNELEFSCRVKGSQVIIVLGHTKCAAIKDLYFQSESNNSRLTAGNIRPSTARRRYIENSFNLSKDKFTDFLTEIYVRSSLILILAKAPLLYRMIEKGQVLLFGAVYNKDNGRIKFF